MEFKIIKTEKEYNKALAMFEKLFLAKRGTKESDIADVLAILIERYENENFHISTADPIETIKYWPCLKSYS